MTLIELAAAVPLFAAYVTLALALSLGIADLLGVTPAAVAFPVAIAPAVILFRKEWRHLWVAVIPVAAAVLMALRHGVTWEALLHSGARWWVSTAVLSAVAFCVWVVLVSFIGIAMGWDQPGKQPPGQG